MLRTTGLTILLCLCLSSYVVLVDTITLRVVEGQKPEINSINSPEEEPTAEQAPSFQPAAYSGPEHLSSLQDTCYHFTDANYEYQLCMFGNMTQQKLSSADSLQHQQLLSNRPTLLGVWSGWLIKADQLTGLTLEGGSSCSDRESKAALLLRQAQVLLHCGPRNELTAVTEPDRCRYLAHFSTPLVCGDDTVMAVYPRLQANHQRDWDVLYTEHLNGLLTDRGYDRRLQELFQAAGLVLSEESRRKLQDQVESSGDDCSGKIKLLEEKVKRLENELSVLRN